MWVFSKLMGYGKANKWPKEVVWFIYASKWVCGSILSDYMKKKNWKMCKVNHDVNFECSARIR